MDPVDNDWFPLPKPVNIQTPVGAKDLFSDNIGPRLFALPGEKQILKAGLSVKPSEAEAMRFVARKTRIPVPDVHESYTKEGVGYILMTRLEGEPLGDVWPSLGKEQKASIATQLKVLMGELNSLTGDFFGSLWHQPCEDIFFMHLPFQPGTISYGPFSSRQEYNRGLIQALANSRPHNALDLTEGLVKKLMALEDNTKVFTHGDLHPMNILVDKSTASVTGIVDWKAAGFSIRGREYYEARARARQETWLNALEEIFPVEERVHFDVLQELDRALISYTFI